MLPYLKPSSRPKPILNPPVKMNELNVDEPKSAKALRLKELLYNMGRCDSFCDDRAVTLPPWTVFQSRIEPDILHDTADVVFNPIIMAPPNDYNTVYTTLKRTKEQMNALGQEICPVTFDMGLLTKALEVVWSRPVELKGVVPMEGGMHFLMSVFAGIGFLYGDAGLKHLLYESDVYAKGTADHILSGKDYDRAMRALIMVDETLQRRFLIQFKAWAIRNAKEIPEIVPEMINKMSECLYSVDEEDFMLLENSIVPLLEEFRAEGRKIPLFQFWDDYLTEVSAPLKLFISSTRHAIWDANQFAKSKLLPFFFASNRTIYARYMPYLFLKMNRLPTEAQESFNHGHFVAKLTPGTFNSVWMDYVLEATENKALKSSGGIIGLTNQDNALTRWFLSRPVTAKYSVYFRENLTQQEVSNRHHTDRESYKKCYNEDVQKMVGMFDETFVDPFSTNSPPTRLINFATGIHVSEEVENSLLHCHKKSRVLLEQFVEERFVTHSGKDEPVKSFYDPVTRNKVKTMSNPKTTVRCKAKDIPMNGEEMYLRLLAINAYKKVPLERVLAFENATVPLSLFCDDGKMVSTKKSDFLDKLESLIEPETVLRTVKDVDSIVFDGMAIIQMLPVPTSAAKPTYDDMASLFWKHVLCVSEGIPAVHVVFDRYLLNSLKSQTREKRGDDVSRLTSVHIQGKMNIPDWKSSLTNGSFKAKLTKFYTLYIAEHCNTCINMNQHVYVSGGIDEKALKVSNDVVHIIEQLRSNHEEADTRMLLHVAYQARHNAKRVIVVSPDTDVFVLLVYHFSHMGVSEVFFKTGRKSTHADLTRFIPIHNVICKLNEEQTNILLSVYALTGCDTCCALFGIGKKKAFKTMMTYSAELQGLADIGKEHSLSLTARLACVSFVGLLYGCNGCLSLNKLRVNRVLENKKVKPRKLPPTDDSFILHVLRCSYQIIIWMESLTSIVELPSPTDYGYEIDTDTGHYIPTLVSQPLAPPELLNDLVCFCEDLCSDACVCTTNEQPCTQACNCTRAERICENVFTVLSIITTEDIIE